MILYRAALTMLSLILLAAGMGSILLIREEFQAWWINREISGWDEKIVYSNNRTLPDYVQTVESIVQNQPINSNHRYLLAQLYQWRAYFQRADRRAFNKTLEEAEAQLEKGIGSRPWWGQGWAALLSNDQQRKRWDATSQHLFETAMALGQYDLGAQLHLITVAARQGSRLPEDVKPVLMELMDKIKRDDNVGVAKGHMHRAGRA